MFRTSGTSRLERLNVGRSHPVHLPTRQQHNRSIIVHVVVCTKNRQPLLTNPLAHELLRRAWSQARTWMVGRYVIMPDHIHVFCAPAQTDVPLGRWIRYWKTLVTKNWPHPHQRPLWQRDFWDRQLRTTESYRAKWEYIRLNPVRHGLVPTADQWPYCGELHTLPWHD